MQDALSVIHEATKGRVNDLAQHREISLRRMYEQLSDQCVYPKAKLLVRDLAAIGHAQGVRLIKADLDAMFEDLLGKAIATEITAAELHKEAFEAIDALLTEKSSAECKKELRELISVAELKLEGIEKLEKKGPQRVA